MTLKWAGNKPRIIGFCGFARTGKNTAANVLTRLLLDTYDIDRIKQLGFADILKLDLEYLVDKCKDYGCDIGTPDFKEKFRPMYVEWSRVYKNITGNNEIWCDLAFKKIESWQYPLVMITDVRYDYEIDRIKKNDGVVFYIDRPGFNPANDEEEQSFGQIYEKYQSTFDGSSSDVIIVKNDGTKLNLGIKCFESLRQKGII